jgi:dipeptidyl aminopeptidase/acylaminoacyl peptidase
MPRTRALTADGPHGPVHAFVHPPTTRSSAPPTSAPYVVLVHGGPTGHEGGVADAKTIALTSRGIGVVQVNYGGSTGYGRDYRERLRGQWGVVDVDDVVAVATGLVVSGDADPGRIAIKGGSAGGGRYSQHWPAPTRSPPASAATAWPTRAHSHRIRTTSSRATSTA